MTIIIVLIIVLIIIIIIIIIIMVMMMMMMMMIIIIIIIIIVRTHEVSAHKFAQSSLTVLRYFGTPLSLLEYCIYFEESPRHEQEHLISTAHLTQQAFDTDNPGP